MSKSKNFEAKFIAAKSDNEKLKKIFQITEISEICSTILKVKEELGLSIWSSVLSNLDDEEKVFDFIEELLPMLNRDQLSTKVLNDFYSRLCIELSRYSLEFCVKFAHFCEGRIQFGDPRACFFKDCLPCILQILAKADRSVTFDGVTKTSSEYREQIIKGIFDKPFKVTILTAITSMFKDIPLEKNQTKQLLGKICDNFSNVSHKEISGLALACFNLALFKRLDIPVLALDTYFYNKRYKKKFLEMESESDVESIDETAEKGLIETEDNVIFHFQHVTEFTSIEHMLEKALKPLAFAPKFIISPFIATILVSFAKMSSSSVSGNLRLPQSILLPFIKKVFKNNENHREILRQSAWARSVDQFEPIDIEKLLQVLQENTCKLGQNIALNGFIGLTFMLLKTKNAPTLNSFSIKFLNELCKHRQEFASDIMKIVVKMLFSETNKAPIIECFSIMIQNRSLPIHLCEEALTDLVENLTELELETALAIESVIFNAVSKSSKLRELMSSTMRAAMYQNKRGMRKLAVFSFCVMLKKVTKPTQAGANEAFVPTQNISMMSLMSQSQLPSTEKASMRRVSVLVLEILGILRKCFSHSVDVRETLYESLLKAVTANPFIIPNVLELVEPYFRDYFDSEDPGEIINFSKAFKQDEEGNVIVIDHLGKFLEFIVGCIEVAGTKIKEDGNAQLKNYQKVIESLTTKILDVTLENLEIFSTLDTKVSKTITQFLNCLEVLMAHNSRSLDRSVNILKLTKLIEKHHQMTLEAKKLQESNKKSIKRGKNQTEVAAPKVEIDFECIWDLETCEKFVGVAFLDNPNETINQIKQNKGFVLFVLNSTSSRIQQLPTAPDYLKLKYSRSSFAALKSISSTLYMELELESFEALYDRFDAECAVTLTEAFKNVLIVMDSIYNTPTKWQEFFKKTTNTSHDIDKMNVEVIKRLQRIIDWLFDPEREAISNDSKGEKTVLNLFMAMELLFKNFQNIPNAFAREAYNWLLKFCKGTEIDQKNLHVINKVLFQVMSQQDADNTMMEHIADKISSIYGCLEENIAKPLDVSQNDIKTITKATVELSFKHFCDVIKKQIGDVEFCILRMNSFNAHVKIPGQDSRNESVNALQSLEKSCVVKLTHLGRVLARLLNSQFNTKGIQIETAGRVATNYFTCLCNLIKHLLQHFAVKTLDFTIIPLEMLMKQTKITSKVAFLLAPYAEDAYQEDQKQTAKDKKEKKKIVAPKEFKFVTGLVRTNGNFLKSVQRLDEQTKRNFSKFIYTGDVRDFRIDMKKTGNLTREKSVEETVVSSDEEVAQDSDSDTPIQPTRKRSRIIQSRSSSENEDSDATDVSKEIQQPIRRGGFEENIKKLCAKGAKRKRK